MPGWLFVFYRSHAFASYFYDPVSRLAYLWPNFLSFMSSYFVWLSLPDWLFILQWVLTLFYPPAVTQFSLLHTCPNFLFLRVFWVSIFSCLTHLFIFSPLCFAPVVTWASLSYMWLIFSFSSFMASFISSLLACLTFSFSLACAFLPSSCCDLMYTSVLPFPFPSCCSGPSIIGLFSCLWLKFSHSWFSSFLLLWSIILQFFLSLFLPMPLLPIIFNFPSLSFGLSCQRSPQLIRSLGFGDLDLRRDTGDSKHPAAAWHF